MLLSFVLYLNLLEVVAGSSLTSRHKKTDDSFKSSALHSRDTRIGYCADCVYSALRPSLNFP